MKKVVINANCHGKALIEYLERCPEFRAKYQIIPIPMVHMNERKEIGDELLLEADVYIHQDIRTDNMFGYKLSDEYTSSKLSSKCVNITIPNLVGFGDWLYPNLGELISGKSSNMRSVFRDSILDMATDNSECEGIEDYYKYYNSYHIEGQKLQDYFERDIAKMRLREEFWDVKISNFILSKFREIPMFVDAGHPSKYLMEEIGDQVLKLLGINETDFEINYESNLGIPSPCMQTVKDYWNISFTVPCEPLKSKLFPRCLQYDEERYVKEYIIEYLYVVHDKLVGIIDE